MKDIEKIRPPRWADNFLQWFCEPHLLEEIQGDLYEVFYKRCRNNDLRKAQMLFVLDVIRSLSLRTIKNPFQAHKRSASMLLNYLKSGWRNFVKYKSYSLINIFGLSIGFSSALLLFLIIRYESSFDTFHSHADRIYRVGNSFKGGGFDDLIVTPQLPAMAKDYPDIVRASRFHGAEDILGTEDRFVRTSYHVVDSDFAGMFDFRMVSGDLGKALASPNQIVLTRSKAEQLFGDQDPMGRAVRLVNEGIEFTIAAIADDPPKNSTLQFEALVPWANAPKWLDINQAGNWYNTFMVGYIELSPKATKEEMEEKLQAFRDTHFLEERRSTWSVLLLPLKGEHFRSAGSQGMIAILGIIAGAILLISCINFMNLSLAQALKRAKEVGLRRVLGSLRRHISFQFMIEAFITSGIALAFGIAITWLVLPHLNSYYDIGVTIDIQQSQFLIVCLGALCLLPALCASVAPSLTLSGLKPVNAMRGVIRKGVSGEYLRRVLITLQFAASIILLIGTAIIWQQTSYMKSQDLRFNETNVVAIDAWPELFKDPEKARQGFLAFRDELGKETVVEAAAFTSNIPGQYDENYNTFTSADAPDSEKVSLRQVYVDHNFFKTFGMQIVAGRSFVPEMESDRNAVVINESAMKMFGWTDLENKEIAAGGEGQRLKVVGVVEDYYYQSLKRSVQPLIHFYVPDNVGRLAVRLKAGRIEEGLELIRRKWEALAPYESFDYRFVDSSFDALYKEQDRLSATASLFSFIAVAISCLGLFSITAYSIRLRRKEVSIRKVLGASVSEIVLKLSRSYGLMIATGFAIACPIAYYLGNSFLADFAHRIAMSPMVFIGMGAVVYVLSMFIVGWLSGRAALENPVDALKEE